MMLLDEVQKCGDSDGARTLPLGVDSKNAHGISMSSCSIECLLLRTVAAVCSTPARAYGRNARARGH
jgi:hypothetical protein